MICLSQVEFGFWTVLAIICGYVLRWEVSVIRECIQALRRKP